MTLVVKTLVSAETIRDGGSLAAFFRDHYDAEWILFLELRQAFHEGQVEMLGFAEPVLIDASPESRPMDTSGRIHSVLSGPRRQLTWQEAQTITIQLAKGSASLTEWGAEALKELCGAVARQGELAPGTERFARTFKL